MSDPTVVEELRDLVILHAGNPDDGCCRIWLGAPVTADEASLTSWAWHETVWKIADEPAVVESGSSNPETPPHHELPEPDIDLQPVAQEPIAENPATGDPDQ